MPNNLLKNIENCTINILRKILLESASTLNFDRCLLIITNRAENVIFYRHIKAKEIAPYVVNLVLISRILIKEIISLL